MNKLLELLNASNKIAFAVFLAGLVLLLGKYLHLLPFPLSDHLTGWLAVASVLGACVLFASIIVWFYSVASRGGKGLKRWWKAWTVMNRLDELTKPELLALYWIAYHPDEAITGNRFYEPFRRLREKGYLNATDMSVAVQGFKVNSRVYAGRKKLKKLLPKSVYHYEGNMAPPWK